MILSHSIMITYAMQVYRQPPGCKSMKNQARKALVFLYEMQMEFNQRPAHKLALI